MFVDGSSTSLGSGVGIVIKSPEADNIEYAITLEFPASNNEAEYEAILLGSRLIHAAESRKVHAFTDSQLVVNQVIGEYEARKEKMSRYLTKLREEMDKFEKFELEQIPREENSTTDQLAKLVNKAHFVSGRKVTLLSAAKPIVNLERENIEKNGEVFMGENLTPPWTTHIIQFLKRGRNPSIRPKRDAKGNWVHELSGVLWAYRAIPRHSTQKTPFNLVYGTKAVLPAKIGEETWMIKSYDITKNLESRREDLDLVEERREMTERRVHIYKSRMTRAYDNNVRPRGFKEGDLVLGKTKAAGSVGKLDAKWDGPYVMTEVIGPGTYRLKKGDGKPLPPRGM
ncbi:UNVERIFIED_CONTAM: hypothetical protein Slati_0009800 [Sesamum latifolium]|uniref:RNase H type-1 domain-containing protein n=1 Tax=Sesamum latifolium TaxID=2727402 RepID=A0AAW2Y5V9_9LAMI